MIRTQNTWEPQELNWFCLVVLPFTVRPTVDNNKQVNSWFYHL